MMRKIKVAELTNEKKNALALKACREEIDDLREQVEDLQMSQSLTNTTTGLALADYHSISSAIGDKISFLRKTTAGLVFIVAGLAVSSLMMKKEIRELRNMMNEG